MQPLDLPSNWLFLHPGIRNKIILNIYDRCKQIMERVAEKLLSGKRIYKAFLSLPFDMAIAPVAVGYYFFGRFFLAKTLVASNKCTNCDLCMNQCPVGAIKKVGDRMFWTYKCESCMRCANICPHRAIETAHGFSLIVPILFYLILFPFVENWLIRDFNLNLDFQHNIFWRVIKNVVFLFLYFLGYRFLHIFLRFKLFNDIIAYSSLSKYLFWRRFKAPKNKKATG